MFKRSRILAAIICVISLSAIGGCNIEGSSSNGQESSNSNSIDSWEKSSGTMTDSQYSITQNIGNGKIGKLSGSTFINLARKRPLNQPPVNIEMQVSVGKGSVRVSLRAPNGQIIATTASPGSPANLEGFSKADSWSRLRVKIEALEESAEQIEYTFTYRE